MPYNYRGLPGLNPYNYSAPRPINIAFILTLTLRKLYPYNYSDMCAIVRCNYKGNGAVLLIFQVSRYVLRYVPWLLKAIGGCAL